MGSLPRVLLMPLLFIGFSSAALAGGKQERGAAGAAVSPEMVRPALTGKERLGPKWTDEQRLDNCKVPVEKRGTKPRSSACDDSPPS